MGLERVQHEDEGGEGQKWEGRRRERVGGIHTSPGRRAAAALLTGLTQADASACMDSPWAGARATTLRTQCIFYSPHHRRGATETLTVLCHFLTF